MRKVPGISLNISKRCSEFEKKVYREVLLIPLGEVRTYKEIARNIGHPKAYRAVGQALKKNPYPFIIPCHRVIRSDGYIGGYVYGKRIKKILIELEKDLRKALKM